jgi:hypothetical protein
MEKVPIVTEPRIGGAIIRSLNSSSPSKRPTSTEKRSNSASKSLIREVATGIVAEFPKRSTSTRKIRRWENSNLFGLDIHRHYIEEYLEAKDENPYETAFSAESKSCFQDLLESKDHELIDRFRRGEDLLIHHFNQLKLQPKKHTIESDNEETIIERGLLDMERKLRHIFLHKVKDNLTLLEFVWKTEQLLFAYHRHLSQEKEVETTNPFLIPDDIYWNLITYDTIKVTNNRKELKLHLKSTYSSNPKHSSFLRLLVHGLCQFHHLRSRSEAVKGYSPHEKIMFLGQSRNPSTPISKSIQHEISLARYLLDGFLHPEESFEALLAAKKCYHLCDVPLSSSPDSIIDIDNRSIGSVAKTESSAGLDGFEMIDFEDFEII